jgi:TRAP-type C4-dicarboxylate transport system substrate-binding protein
MPLHRLMMRLCAAIAVLLSQSLPGRFLRSEVFELPFLVSDAEAASRAFWDVAQEEMATADFKDMHLLGTWVHGPGVIHAARRVERLEDMVGLRLRAPSRITTRLLEGLGAAALGMAVPAVPEALARGVIDGALLPWEVTSSIRAPELVGFHTEFPDRAIYVATFILAMNKQAYGRLPPDLRAVIDAASGAEFSGRAGRLQQGADAPARAVAEARGNTILVLSDAEAARWQQAGASVTQAWLSEMEKAGIDGAALLEKTHAAIARYEP